MQTDSFSSYSPSSARQQPNHHEHAASPTVACQDGDAFSPETPLRSIDSSLSSIDSISPASSSWDSISACHPQIHVCSVDPVSQLSQVTCPVRSGSSHHPHDQLAAAVAAGTVRDASGLLVDESVVDTSDYQTKIDHETRYMMVAHQQHKDVRHCGTSIIF